MNRKEAKKQIVHHIKRSKYWAKRGNFKATDYNIDLALLCGSEYGVIINCDIESTKLLAQKNSVKLKATKAVNMMKKGRYANAEDLKEEVEWKAKFYHTGFDLDDFYKRLNRADKRK